MRLVEGPAKPLTERFLARWDLAAVKSLLRMRHHDLDASERGMLTPGPSLTVPLMRTFAEKNSMEELVHALSAWNPELCAPLDAALTGYRQDNDLSVLEEAMDLAYFTRGVAELKSNDDVDSKILRGALRMEIDRINLRTMLQFRDAHGSGDALSNRILPGGWLNMRLLREMAGARDAAHAMEFLANTPYKELVEELYAFVRAARFSPMDRHFDLLMIRHLQHEKHVHVMSIATLMHYAWLKYNEAINLRLVTCGTACHLPHGKIREEMVHA
jgi:vacuolar-type H+-ATPase subunit C/Vma6